MGACMSKNEPIVPIKGNPAPAAKPAPVDDATTPAPSVAKPAPVDDTPPAGAPPAPASEPRVTIASPVVVQAPAPARTTSAAGKASRMRRRSSVGSAGSVGPTTSSIQAVDADEPGVAVDWFPEYMPENVLPPTMYGATTFSSRGTRTSKANLLQEQLTIRKTKIVCTMGPACWSEETLGRLMDAGMNIARFNFSHGDHAGHGEVLERFRKVAGEKQSNVAVLLDTKGPEIRTAMLRDHKNILLEKDQDIIVEAVGDAYTTFEGYKTEEETRIGLSYGKLCQSVSPGKRILIADGTIVIEVAEILSETTLKGKVLNTKDLGERKNCNLPGVVVDIPVLTPHDINDVQNFCAKHKMDFIAASFVQSAEDVRFIRKTLDEAGGQDVKIICKIENEAGLRNIDEIIRETDGIMVARGDLGMEIPSEKVALAQKMLITKCNIAGKFVITATQMLESMISNPLPTRAEMTDVANAVYDGSDAVMLSGETANGSFPDTAVAIMAAIVANAELGIDYYSQYLFIRRWNVLTSGGISCLEATLSCAAQSAIEFSEDLDGNGVIDAEEGALVLVLSSSGTAANLVSKYRPTGPIIVVTDSDATVRATNARFAQYPFKVASLGEGENTQDIIAAAMAYAGALGFLAAGKQVIVASGPGAPCADNGATVRFVGGAKTHRPSELWSNPTALHCIKSLITTAIDHDLLSSPAEVVRSTKIVCTMGPACWSEESLGKLLDAGMNIARFNFSHGDHAGHGEVLERFRKVAAAKGSSVAVLMDTKGPEVRTAMLRDHKNISLVKDQDIIIEAVGDSYTTFEGYKTEEETRIGLSYGKLCQSVKAGNRILIADGTIVIQVVEILSETTLKGKVLNSKELGERKNCNLPGVVVDIPVLTPHDINDVQNFCAKHKMDFIAASFVQSGNDVRFIRKILDEAGGFDVKIISKIENEAGMENLDEIIRETDGIMVARGDLGMEIPSERVPLAQKMMISKCNIAGKFVITATQMLESMCKNPLPTRAEMTDVANAVFDGTDAVMLSGETANGAFPDTAVAIMSAIVANAEKGINRDELYNFTRNWTPKPMSFRETITSSACQAALDMKAIMLTCFTNDLATARLLSKWRPPVPILLVTTDETVRRQCNAYYGLHPMLVDEVTNVPAMMPAVAEFARKHGIAALTPDDGTSDQVIVVSGVNMMMTGTKIDMTTYVFGEESADIYPSTGYHGEETLTFKSTKVGLDMVCEPVFAVRKTKIVCTMGPACWSEETIGKLMDAGMNIARFNFSHGDHKGHGEVLERFRKVAAEKKSDTAVLMDTKGPEIRTAMLRDHKNIILEKDQDIVIEAVGDDYTKFEGYKTDEETRIGLSYGKLCQSVKVGNQILIADGTIVIEVKEILSETTLKGKVLNTKDLGERKNCNLPGVVVDIPVLTPHDINDVQNFCAKHKMDFIAASFVQTGEDVRFIRKTLDEAGGQDVKIISKIENEAGLKNIDDIIRETDGIMVARGDLGMEIPSEKVSLAQKMLITKCNIAGKFVITATQMLESMVKNPLPTRAEMTDVANAVFDGTDAVMLSGETANGSFPETAVEIMANIAKQAETGINYYQVGAFVRDFTPRPFGTVEAVLSSVAKNAIDIGAGLIVVFSENGHAARLIAKYHPCVPALVITSSAAVVASCQSTFSLLPYKLFAMPADDNEFFQVLGKALKFAVSDVLCPPGSIVVVARGISQVPGQWKVDADTQPVISLMAAPGARLASTSLMHRFEGYIPHYEADKTVSIRCNAISLQKITSSYAPVRKTKVFCTLGPACWSEETLAELLDAGLNVARFNFSHGDHQGHGEVLERFRKVAAAKGSSAAVLMDTKGPEIRTAMLRDHKNILLEKDQDIIVEAVGDAYTTFEGYKTDEETRIGISYDKLCQSVDPGNRILIADGTIVIEVKEILNGTTLRGKVLNTKELGERKNCNLPGVEVDIPVLTPHDINDVQNFCAKHKMDFIAASFVQSGDDVRFIRKTLDEAGGQNVKIISKIENEAGLANIDEIIRETDGIMVARGDLGMEIPSEKVALAQKWLITKCNIAGKFVVTATQMLESMITNPLPTRAEMTDVANAVFDGSDAVMLSGETANGAFPCAAVSAMAMIVRNAELVNNYYATFSFVRDFTPKPFSTDEAVASCAVKSCIDANAQVILVFTATGNEARLVSKYRPNAPILVLTPNEAVLRCASAFFGQYTMLLEPGSPLTVDRSSMREGGLVAKGVKHARVLGLLPENPGSARIVVLAQDSQGSVCVTSIDTQE